MGDLRGPSLVQGRFGLRIGVWIENLNVNTTVGTIEAEPGTRLLVSGEPWWGGDTRVDAIFVALRIHAALDGRGASEWRTAF